MGYECINTKTMHVLPIAYGLNMKSTPQCDFPFFNGTSKHLISGSRNVVHLPSTEPTANRMHGVVLTQPSLLRFVVD